MILPGRMTGSVFGCMGPALEVEKPGSGVDVWVKSTRELIINKWYKLGDYHVDYGEWFDGYKVGESRGCGGLVVWENGKLVPSKNFKKWQVLANGPVRAGFRLDMPHGKLAGEKYGNINR